MKFVALASAAMLAVALAQAQDETEAFDAKPAAAAAESWLALVDTGRYGESWEAAARPFRAETPRIAWETKVEAARAPLGVVISRKLRSAAYSRGLGGEHLYVMQYDTRFATRPRSTEIVTPLRGADGVWRVSAYVLR